MTWDLIFWLKGPCHSLNQEFSGLQIKQARKRVNGEENSQYKTKKIIDFRPFILHT